MGADSDIDLFIVRPKRVGPDNEKWRDQLDALSRKASGWTGNDVRVLEYSNDEVVHGLAIHEPVIGDIRSEGFTLVGSSSYLRRTPRKRS
jgi:hypothetical protein